MISKDEGIGRVIFKHFHDTDAGRHFKVAATRNRMASLLY